MLALFYFQRNGVFALDQWSSIGNYNVCRWPAGSWNNNSNLGERRILYDAKRGVVERQREREREASFFLSLSFSLARTQKKEWRMSLLKGEREKGLESIPRVSLTSLFITRHFHGGLSYHEVLTSRCTPCFFEPGSSLAQGQERRRVREKKRPS